MQMYSRHPNTGFFMERLKEEIQLIPTLGCQRNATLSFVYREQHVNVVPTKQYTVTLSSGLFSMRLNTALFNELSEIVTTRAIKVIMYCNTLADMYLGADVGSCLVKQCAQMLTQ